MGFNSAFKRLNIILEVKMALYPPSPILRYARGVEYMAPPVPNLGKNFEMRGQPHVPANLSLANETL